MSQVPYSGFALNKDPFVDNPDPRAPCILLMDTSGSMSGDPIAALNAGLQEYRESVLRDHLAARRVELAIVTFGGSVEVAQDFVTPQAFTPPALTASGDTPMATAIVKGIHMLERRKEEYRTHGIGFYRPWIFLFTDGAPTDTDGEWRLACEAIRRGESEKKFVFYAVGVEQADFSKLREASPGRDPLRLKGLAFAEFFKWLSNSQSRVSQSSPGDTMVLLNPAAPGGWGEIPL
jgi:uncharacterized protein YegL